MSKLREAAQAVLNDYDRGVSIVVTERVIARLRAALAQPETAEPPRDEWRPASEPPEDGRRVLIWVATESGEGTFRPAYCPAGGWTSLFDGATLVAWRDVTPPTTEGK